jgi:hypothetical protein
MVGQPLQQVDRVSAVVPVHFVGRKAAVPNPTIYGPLGYPEDRGEIADGEQHTRPPQEASDREKSVRK